MNHITNKHLALALPHVGAGLYVNSLNLRSGEGSYWATADAELEKIMDEIKLLKTAIKTRNYNKYRHHLTGARFQIDVLAERCNIDVIEDFTCFMEAKMEGLDRTEVEAEATRQMYAHGGVETFYTIINTDDETYYITAPDSREEKDVILPTAKEVDPVYPLKKWQKAFPTIEVAPHDTTMLVCVVKDADITLSVAQIRHGDGYETLHGWLDVLSGDRANIYQSNGEDKALILQMWDDHGDIMVRNYTGLTLQVDLIANVAKLKNVKLGHTNDHIHDVPLKE